MPDYGDPSGKVPYKTIFMHFKTQEEVDEFAGLMKQQITPKTKFMWYEKV